MTVIKFQSAGEVGSRRGREKVIKSYFRKENK